jgi:radical SAM protein with 4Fe4S-binding SPASM domain
MKRLFSAPTVVNLEITEICNVKCRHCYNFWRDDSIGQNSLDIEKFDKIIDRIIEAEVFHVVLTGGEPMAKFPMLEHGFAKLKEAKISFSCNSNLMLCTDERAKKLANLGLDHILTSLPSRDPVTNDFIMGKEGSFNRIMKGIENATKNGIRVSANMVVSKSTYNDVYETAKLAASKGCQKIFTTRMVPPTYTHDNVDTDYLPTAEETKIALDQAIQAKKDFGIMVGTLVSYPLCFLGDLEKYSDFVGRGCPGQSGHQMSINATGDTHSCAHEAEGYGNVFTKPIKEIYQQPKMKKWRTSYHFDGCKGCDYIDVCESGCRMTAKGHSGKHAGMDPLFLGPHVFEKHVKIVEEDDFRSKIKSGMKFLVPQRLRFRKEDGFYLVNARWANTMPIENNIAEFLIEYKETEKTFTLAEFGEQNMDLLANLYYKDVIVDEAQKDVGERGLKGLSINLDALPSRRLRSA